VINYWGDSNEHRLRKAELKRAAQEMQFNRRVSDNIEFTSLGIADKVGERSAQKKFNRRKARNAVMEEQDMQEHEGVYDDELLADVYTITSAGAKRAAHEHAEALQKEVSGFDEQTN
jgi:hypothetical protein